MSQGVHLRLEVPATAESFFEAALSGLGGALVASLGTTPEAIVFDLYLAEAPEEAVLAARLAAASAAGGIAVPRLSRQAVPERDWVAESQRNLPPQPVGRFYLHGSHARPTRRFGPAVTLEIEAGRAFGTGLHGSTQGCLLALDRLARLRRRPRRVLDLGCGSGVLAIAAARLWRRLAVASDIDRTSVEVARDNARLNRAARWIRFDVGDGLSAEAVRRGRPYDLVLANILAEPLAAMAEEIATATRPGGRIVLAGLLASQERAVRLRFLRAGCRLERRIPVGGWMTLVLRRRGRTTRRA